MNVQTRPSGHQPWEEVRTRLDQNAPFSNICLLYTSDAADE